MTALKLIAGVPSQPQAISKPNTFAYTIQTTTGGGGVSTLGVETISGSGLYKNFILKKLYGACVSATGGVIGCKITITATGPSNIFLWSENLEINNPNPTMPELMPFVPKDKTKRIEKLSFTTKANADIGSAAYFTLLDDVELKAYLKQQTCS